MIVATVVAVGVVLAISIAPVRAPAIASDSEIKALEQVAEQACRCTRIKGDAKRDGCWENYDRRTKGLIVSTWATACAPVSTYVDCFDVNGEEACITTGYNSGQLCNAREAQAAENAYNTSFKRGMRRFRGDSDKASAAADDAFNEVVNAIRNGDVPTVTRSSQGCT